MAAKERNDEASGVALCARKHYEERLTRVLV